MIARRRRWCARRSTWSTRTWRARASGSRPWCMRSACRGRFVVPDAVDLPGRFVRRGELVAYVADRPRRMCAWWWIRTPSAGAQPHRIGPAACSPTGRPTPVPSRILRQVPAATDRLPSLALGSAGGGPIAVDPARRQRPDGAGAGLRARPGAAAAAITPTTWANASRCASIMAPSRWRSNGTDLCGSCSCLGSASDGGHAATAPRHRCSAPIRNARHRAPDVSSRSFDRSMGAVRRFDAPQCRALSRCRAPHPRSGRGAAAMSDTELERKRSARRVAACAAEGLQDAPCIRTFALVRELSAGTWHAPLRCAAARRLGHAPAAWSPRWRPARARP